MRAAILALALGAALLPVTAQAQGKQVRKANAPVPGTDAEGVYYVRAGDPVLKKAMDEARRTLPDFFVHFANPAPGEREFSIKYDLLPEDGKAEYIWADVISHTPGVTIARLANVPVDPRFKQGEKVTVTDGEIVDWSYYRDGVTQGSFTTRAMLPRYSPEEAETIRKALGG